MTLLVCKRHDLYYSAEIGECYLCRREERSNRVGVLYCPYCGEPQASKGNVLAMHANPERNEACRGSRMLVPEGLTDEQVGQIHGEVMKLVQAEEHEGEGPTVPSADPEPVPDEM